MKEGDKIIVIADIDGLTKGKIYSVRDVAYKNHLANEECKQNKYIYVRSEIYINLMIRLSENQYDLVKKETTIN